MTALLAIGKWCLEYWYVVALAALIAGLAAYGQTMRSERDSARVELADYRAEVADERTKAAKAALAKAIEDERKKEQADAENERERNRLAGELEQLRQQQPLHVDLPASRPGSLCPDGQVCFERAEYGRAYREFVAEIRQVANECTALEADLNTSKRWATTR